MTSSRSPRRRLLLAVLLTVLSLLLSGCGLGGKAPTQITKSKDGDPPSFTKGSTMATIQARGHILVGVTPNLAPFSSQNPNTGSWEGFDIATANQIATAIFGTNIEGKVQFIPLDPRDREAAIAGNRVDIAVGRYVITVARKRFVDFAGPYAVSTQDMLYRARDTEGGGVTTTTINDIVDLNQKNICVVPGSTNIDAVTSAIPLGKQVSMSTLAECANALSNRQVQAIVADHVDLIPISRALGTSFTTTRTNIGAQPYGIGVHSNTTEFRSFINDTLENWKQWNAEYTATTGDSVTKQPAVDRY